MAFKLLATIQYILPQHLLSRIAGIVAHWRFSWLKNLLIRAFIRYYKVDMKEAEKEDVSTYDHFNSFFTRALKPAARPMPPDEKLILSPVDGCISQMGQIAAGQLVQAKGFDYSLESLLAGSKELADLFTDGTFITFYLAPRDYHRVHMPISGKLKEMIYVPGKLFSVNMGTADTIPRLFTRNERLVNIFATAKGPMAVVMVGALIVGSMATSWQGVVKPPIAAIKRYNYHDIDLERGAELGRFQLGSTVILLFGANAISWLVENNIGSNVLCKQAIARSQLI